MDDREENESDSELHMYDNSIPGCRQAVYVQPKTRPKEPSNEQQWAENQEKLRKCHLYLLDEINANDIIDFVYQEGALTWDDVDEIRSTNPNTNKTRMRILLRKIVQRKNFGFEVLIKGLRQRRYLNAVEKIINTPVDTEHCFLSDSDYLPADTSENSENVTEFKARNIEVQTIQELKLDADLFVETGAYSKAKKLIFQHGCLFISGGPGEGKTLMSRQIVLTLMQKDYHPVIVREIRDLEFWNPEEKTVILCEDLFGKSSLLNAAALDSVKTVIDKFIAHWKYEEQSEIAIENTRLYLIITTKSCLLTEAHVRIRKSLSYFMTKNCVLDLTQKHYLSENERLEILQSHLRYHNIDMDEKVKKSIVNETAKLIGFPECCRLFVDTSKSGDFESHPVDFFSDPQQFLVSIIENMFIEKKNHRAVFYLLIHGNGTIKESDICALPSKLNRFLNQVGIRMARPKDIEDAAACLCSGLLVSNSSFITARHPSIFDAIAYIIGCYNPLIVLQYCSLDFIYQRVRLVNKADMLETDNWFLIKIAEENYQYLAVRFANEVREQCTDLSLICSHQACSLPDFVNLLFKHMKAKTFLKHGSLTKLINDKSKKCEEFLYWASWNTNGILCEKTLHYQSFTDNELLKALYGATISGNKEAFLLLYKKLNRKFDSHSPCGVDYVSTPQTKKTMQKTMKIKEPLICIAAKYGKTEILKTMAKEGFSLSVKGKGEKTPLHYACDSGYVESAKMLIDQEASLTASAVTYVIPLALVRDDSLKTQLAHQAQEPLLKELRLLISKLKDQHTQCITEETEGINAEICIVLKEVFNHHICSRKNIANLMCEEKVSEKAVWWLKHVNSSNKQETAMMCAANLINVLAVYVPLHENLIKPFMTDDIPDVFMEVLSKCEFLDDCIIQLLWSLHKTENGKYYLQDETGIKLVSLTLKQCKKAWTKAKAVIICGLSIQNYRVLINLISLIENEVESFWWLLVWLMDAMKSENRNVNIGCFNCKWCICVSDIVKTLSSLAFSHEISQNLLSLKALAFIVNILETGYLEEKKEAMICFQRLALNAGQCYNFLLSCLDTKFMYTNTMSLSFQMEKPGGSKDKITIHCSHLAVLNGLFISLLLSRKKETFSIKDQQTLKYLMKDTYDSETRFVSALIYKLVYSDGKNKDVCDLAYFHDTLSYDDANDLLELQPAGTFLLRTSLSNNNQITLSYKEEDGIIRHILLESDVKDLFLSDSFDKLRQLFHKVGKTFSFTKPLDIPRNLTINVESLLLKWIVKASTIESHVHTETIGEFDVSLPLNHMKKLINMIALHEFSQEKILKYGGLEVMISLLEISENDPYDFSVFHSEKTLGLITSWLKKVAMNKRNNYIFQGQFNVKLTLHQLLLAFSSFSLESNQILQILEEDIMQILANILEKDITGNDDILICLKIIQNLCTFTDCHSDLKKLLSAVDKHCSQEEINDKVKMKARKTMQLLKKLS